MDWETFLQGVRETRTGLWIFWLALAAVLLAAFGVLLVIEPLGEFWAWAVAPLGSIREFASRQEPLEVVSVVAWCVLFLSVAALVALPLLFVFDRSRRSKPQCRVGTAGTTCASTRSSPS